MEGEQPYLGDLINHGPRPVNLVNPLRYELVAMLLDEKLAANSEVGSSGQSGVLLSPAIKGWKGKDFGSKHMGGGFRDVFFFLPSHFFFWL